MKKRARPVEYVQSPLSRNKLRVVWSLKAWRDSRETPIAGQRKKPASTREGHSKRSA